MYCIVKRVRFLSVVSGFTLETLLGLSLGTEDTTHNNEVSVKWVSTVISFLFWTVHALLQCQVYFYTRVTPFLLSIFVEEWLHFYPDFDYCACASSRDCHRVSFPKVSNNRVYFGANQHKKITIFTLHQSNWKVMILHDIVVGSERW